MVMFIATAAVFFADPGPVWHGDALIQDVGIPIMDEGDGGGDGDGNGGGRIFRRGQPSSHRAQGWNIPFGQPLTPI